MEGPGWERLSHSASQMMTLQVVSGLITVVAQVILQGPGLEERGVALWELLFYLKISELS